MYIRKMRTLDITAKTIEDALRPAPLQPIKRSRRKGPSLIERALS
jgi:hypothetical protein